MRVAVTGTPGTGKTTATSLLENRIERDAGTTDHLPSLDVIHLNDVLETAGLYTAVDAERGSKIADMEALESWLADREDVLFESHLAHHFPADRVVVLRCRPDLLEQRLRDRGEPEAKAVENAESEALDVVLAAAVERHGVDVVFEIDTTDRDPDAVADALLAVLTGDREPRAGTVDFVGYLS